MLLLLNSNTLMVKSNKLRDGNDEQTQNRGRGSRRAVNSGVGRG